MRGQCHAYSVPRVSVVQRDGLAPQLRIALRPRHLTQYLHIVSARAGAGGAARQSLRRKLALPPILCSEERGQLGVRSRLGRRTLPAMKAAAMKAVDKDLLAMKVAELKEELEARGEGRTGNKAWLRRRLHAAIVREYLGS